MYVRYVVDVVEEEHVLESEKTIFLVFNASIHWLYIKHFEFLKA
jgi:hypothetical protein